MITSVGKNGIKRRVIFNGSVLLVDKDDSISFSFQDEKTKLDHVFNFDFSNEGEELTTSGNVSNDGKVINLILHKWNNLIGAEVTKPIESKISDTEKIWIKFKTSADIKNSFRSFHLTVWVEEK